MIHSLTKDELKRLLSAAKEENQLHWLAIIVAFTHGLRASEVCEMTAVQIKDGYLTVKRKKGSLQTTQKLIGEETEPLESLVFGRDKNFRLFPWSTRWFQKLVHKYGEKAGIPYHKSTPHKLKHTCAMLGIEGGIKIHELQQKLGHKNLDSTGQYLKINDDQAGEAWRKAVGL